MSNLIKDRLEKEVIMYTKDGEEYRGFVENEEQKQAIFEQYDNVEILTVQQCIEHGIGYPAMETDLLKCNTCGIEGYWDKGSDNGNIFYCEVCNDYTCFKCLNNEGLFGDNVICKHCVDKYKLTETSIKRMIEGYSITRERVLRKINKDEIRIFNSVEHYIDWMYDDRDSKRDFFDSIIYDQINTGSLSLAEFLVKADQRVVQLENGRLSFLFI